jgi:hypothetical protein
MADELIPKELRDRLHGTGCSCPWHSPELYPEPADNQPVIVGHEQCPGCVNCERGQSDR